VPDTKKEVNSNNKTLGLIAKIRNKLEDKTIILIFSLLPYFITYYYQIGFLRHLRISLEFVDFSFQILLKDTVLAVIIALILFTIIDHMAKNDLPYKKSAVALMSFIVYAIDKLVSYMTSFIRKIFNRPKKEKWMNL
jgi:hypothetical protein